MLQTSPVAALKLQLKMTKAAFNGSLCALSLSLSVGSRSQFAALHSPALRP